MRRTAWKKLECIKNAKKYKTIKEIFAVEDFDEHIITDTNGNAHEIKDCYPIFITEKPEVGDIAFVPKRSKFYMVANKDVLKAIKDSGFGATYYTLKYNNRKIEVLKVKRFSCGALDKDISEVPYHVNIEYIDQIRRAVPFVGKRVELRFF